ncbi:hypothetical protein [Jiangella alkaliphila]|uniref:hypothetical protein n=1 Tax=Jiangella alkaliphila TaxID=419479 RepID=UPI00128BC0E1|nr:hypothetical protein [Jiangella alkaliphila]
MTLIEAGDRLAAGVTGRTTAKVSSQRGAIYASLTRRFDPDTAVSRPTFCDRFPASSDNGVHNHLPRYSPDCPAPWTPFR